MKAKAGPFQGRDPGAPGEVDLGEITANVDHGYTGNNTRSKRTTIVIRYSTHAHAKKSGN